MTSVTRPLRIVPKPIAETAGEVIGTFILVFFGLGAVHVAVLTDALAGLWQVASIWGVAVGIAIYATGELSGAHLNPAITLALVVYRGFPWSKVPKYVCAQLVGAILAAAVLYSLFGGLITRFEQSEGIVRGRPGSERSAMIYGEYFPNPAAIGVSDDAVHAVSLLRGMAAEAFGTAALAFIVFIATRPPGRQAPSTGVVAVFIGVGLAMIIAVIAPLTQAGLNPARDFGPRLFSYCVGWGTVAIPGPRGGFLVVYVLGPLLGGLVGGGMHRLLVGPPAIDQSAGTDVTT